VPCLVQTLIALPAFGGRERYKAGVFATPWSGTEVAISGKTNAERIQAVIDWMGSIERKTKKAGEAVCLGKQKLSRAVLWLNPWRRTNWLF